MSRLACEYCDPSAGNFAATLLLAIAVAGIAGVFSLLFKVAAFVWSRRKRRG
jgi:hypothetical protein